MTPIETVQAPSDEQIEALALKHEAFGFGRVDERGLTTHGFDPDGLRAFARALLAQMQARNGLAETERSSEKDSAPVVQVVEPLTLDEIEEICREHIRRDTSNDRGTWPSSIAFARAIEAKHARKWGLSLKENT